MEDWKSIICDSDQCVNEMFETEKPGSPATKLNQETIEKYKIRPDVDNEVLTQFTCPRCGKVTTWGVTRRSIAQQLYERYK